MLVATVLLVEARASVQVTVPLVVTHWLRRLQDLLRKTALAVMRGGMELEAAQPAPALVTVRQVATRQSVTFRDLLQTTALLVMLANTSPKLVAWRQPPALLAMLDGTALQLGITPSVQVTVPLVVTHWLRRLQDRLRKTALAVMLAATVLLAEARASAQAPVPLVGTHWRILLLGQLLRTALLAKPEGALPVMDL